jgi:hypothetical protein
VNAERPAPEPAPGYERLWLDHFDQAGIQTSSKFFTADEPFPVMFEAFAGVETPTDNATTVRTTPAFTNKLLLFFFDIYYLSLDCFGEVNLCSSPKQVISN